MTSTVRVIDGYDLDAEKERYDFPDVTEGVLALNRGTAAVALSAALADSHRDAALYPAAGLYVMAADGICLDVTGKRNSILSVESKRPLGRPSVTPRRTTGRSITAPSVTGPSVTGEEEPAPRALVELLCSLAGRAFGSTTGFEGWLAASGEEALERGLQLARVARYGQLKERLGTEALARIVAELGLEPAAGGEGFGGGTGGLETAGFPLYRAASSPAWMAAWRDDPWRCLLPPESSSGELQGGLDLRPLRELVERPQGLRAALDSGHVPADLVAAVVIDAAAPDAGYRETPPEVLARAGRLRDRGALLVASELECFCRTGRPFLLEGAGFEPDLVALAVGAGLGALLARPAVLERLPPDWRPRLGAIDDTTARRTLAELRCFLEGTSAVFQGLSYSENARLKGVFLRQELTGLKDRFPQLLIDVDGAGGLFGLEVRQRRELVARSARRGLHLAVVGPEAEVSSLRIVLPADVLTREIEHLVTLLAQALEDVASGRRGG
ncbi:MAG: aminotransferase class III-fold pyridoxal phosphate-dependent enzyme [Planctomycetota bacterium]